jgi:CRISPR-associated protein Csh1
LANCAAWAQMAWMINEDTNKCLDKATKAIHSCSPFCLAIKRQSLSGGKKMLERQAEKKDVVYNSLPDYFEKALSLIDGSEKEQAKLFIGALSSEQRIHDYLNRIDTREEAQTLIDSRTCH